MPLAHACRFEWAALASSGPGPAPRPGPRAQQLLRVVTVAASRWLRDLFPTAEVSSPAALLEAVRGHHGSLLVIELLHLCALPWFSLRQAIADNDVDHMHWGLGHAFHQMRAAAQPVHAQASALQLALAHGAAPEVQRVLQPEA